MRRTSLLVAVMVVVGMLAVPAAGAVTQAEQDEQDDDPDIAPGERLSGVIGVQQAELDGEIEKNAFSIALEKADDNATEAGHIAEKLEETETRLDELETRQAELDEQRESGEISEGEYRAEMAQLATEVDNLEEQLNESEAAAEGLPEETLEANGVNVSAIQTLKEDADELTGEEVAAIAQSIAGDENGEVDREDRGEADDRDEERADDDRDDDRTDEEQADDADQQDREQPDETDQQDREQPDDDENTDDSENTDDGEDTEDGEDADGDAGQA